MGQLSVADKIRRALGNTAPEEKAAETTERALMSSLALRITCCATAISLRSSKSGTDCQNCLVVRAEQFLSLAPFTSHVTGIRSARRHRRQNKRDCLPLSDNFAIHPDLQPFTLFISRLSTAPFPCSDAHKLRASFSHHQQPSCHNISVPEQLISQDSTSRLPTPAHTASIPAAKTDSSHQHNHLSGQTTSAS